MPQALLVQVAVELLFQGDSKPPAASNLLEGWVSATPDCFHVVVTPNHPCQD